MTITAQNGGPWTSTFPVTIYRQDQPSAPSDLLASVINSTTAQLTWQDKSCNEQNFRIERKPAGGSYGEIANVGANTTSYTDPTISAGQTYVYRVRAFFGGSSFSSYSNEATIIIPPTPSELVADKIYLRTGANSGSEIENPVSGQQYYLHFDWRNTGGTSTDFRLELKLNNTVICGFNSGSIAANSSQKSWCPSPITWPASANPIVIEGALDINSVINEPDENNNVVRKAFPPNVTQQPNLIATTLSFSPTTVVRGNAINLSGTVANNGNASTGASFNIKCYISSSPNAPDLNLLLNSFTMSALGAGQSNPFNQIGAVPATMPPGQYYVWVSVDPDNAIAESNDTDNLLRTTSLLTVTTGPVGEIKPDVAATQFIGAEFEVAISVKDVQNLFGLSFELNYTNTIYVDVVTPTAANVLPGPFLGNDVIFFANVDEAAGKVGVGISRKSGQGGVPGSGVVVVVKFKSLSTTPAETPVVFSLSNASANDPANAPIPLSALTGTTILKMPGVIVWPGDTNNDKIVNQADVLPLGSYWGKTGPPRANASSIWTGQLANLWSPEIATHADANGDGVVNQGDVLPIGSNWGRTHSGPNTAAGKGDESTGLLKTAATTIRMNITGNTNPGQDFEVEIVVDQVTNLFGVAFELLYSPTNLVDPQSTEAGSFIGSDVIFFPNIDKIAGKLGIGVTRKAGQVSVTGTGVVARIKMRVSSQAVRGQAITLTLQNVTALDQNSQPISLTLLASGQVIVIVSVASRQNESLPATFALHANKPNPFNPSTEISYDLPEASDVRVEIFDMLGKHVRTLVNRHQQAGLYAVIWDGRDENGQIVSSGIFIYQLRAGKFVQSRKMLLLQ